MNTSLARTVLLALAIGLVDLLVIAGVVTGFLIVASSHPSYLPLAMLALPFVVWGGAFVSLKATTPFFFDVEIGMSPEDVEQERGTPVGGVEVVWPLHAMASSH